MNWKLEMVDDAEKGLEAGEKHYVSKIKESPKRRKSFDSGLSRQTSGAETQPEQTQPQQNQVQHSHMNGVTDLEHGREYYSPQQTPTTTAQSFPPSWEFISGTDDNNQKIPNVICSDHNNINNSFMANGFGNGLPQFSPHGSTKTKPAVAFMDSYSNASMERAMDKKMEQIESRLLDKFECAVNRLGQQIDASQQSCTSGIQDVTKAMERSQTLLEAKVEYVFAAQHRKDESLVGDMQSKLEEMAETVFQRAACTYDANSSSVEAIQRSLDSVTTRLAELQDSQQAMSFQFGESIARMSNDWAHQISQDTKATAYTIQTRVGMMEDLQLKRLTEFEDKFATRVEDVVGKSSDKVTEKVTLNMQGLNEKLQSSTEKLQSCIEYTRLSGGNNDMPGNYSKIEGIIENMVKHVGSDTAKNIEMGIGVFGNSLRSQLEHMQSQQLQQRTESESNIAMKFESFASHVQQDSSKNTEKLGCVLDKALKESAERSTRQQNDGLERFRKCLDETSQKQQDKAKDMHTMLASVLEQTIGAKDRCSECSEKVSLLSAQIGTHEDHPHQRRPHTAGGNGSGGGTPTMMRNPRFPRH
jgi:hypothetical protein